MAGSSRERLIRHSPVTLPAFFPDVPGGFRRPAVDLLRSNQGNFAIIFAISMMVMISVAAFALDVGFFVRTGSSFQACADQAAISAAETMCTGRSQKAAETVVYGSHPELSDDAVEVVFGFYDAYDQYGDFSVYKDFIELGDENYPSDQNNAVNAVMVIIADKVKSLTGFNQDKNISAAAVAYVPRAGSIWGGSSHESKAGYAGLSGARPYPMTFAYGNIYVPGNLWLDADVDRRTALLSVDGWISDTNWGTVNSDTLPDIETEVLEKYYMADPGDTLDAYIEKLRATADVVYKADDAGVDHFYGRDGNYCYFDLTRPHDDHMIIFFDAEGMANAKAYITPHACLDRDSGGTEWKGACSIGPSQPAGTQIKNLTFVCTCPLFIESNHANQEPIPMGGKNFDQVHFVSSSSITVNYGNNPIRGVTFYSGGVFRLGGNARSLDRYPAQEHQLNFSVVSCGKVVMNPSVAFHGLDQPWASTCNMTFGPPCPALAPVTLGRLEHISQDVQNP